MKLACRSVAAIGGSRKLIARYKRGTQGPQNLDASKYSIKPENCAGHFEFKMRISQLFFSLCAASFAVAAPVAAEQDIAAVLEADADFPLAELEAWYEKALNGDGSDLEARQYTSSTSNELIDGTACRAVTMIYARGTGQQGNIGDSAAVGPLFFNGIAQIIGRNNLAVQGVTYPANVAGFLAGGDAAGSRTLAQLAQRVFTSLLK